MSVKAKVSLLYSLFMTVLCGLVLALILFVSNNRLLSDVEEQLRTRVEEGVGLIEWNDGSLDLDKQLKEVQNGVYLSVYNSQGTLLYGRIPSAIPYSPHLRTEELQVIRLGEKKWYAYDLFVPVEGYGDLWVRGISSVTERTMAMNTTLRLAGIILPLFVATTLVVGYLFTRRILKPVDQIRSAALEIRRKKDLTKRIDLKGRRDEISRLAAAFDEMLEGLQEGFEREKQFTSDVSHELRTPVSVIISQCEYILEMGKMDADTKEEVEIILEQSQRMSQMLNQLLMLSRADNGKMTLQKEWISLSDMAEAVADELEAKASERKMTLNRNIQPEVHLYADEILLMRLLINLVENAIKYGKAGGWVEIGVREEGQEKIVGYIKDNGIGIPSDQISKIWERFYQVDDARTKSGQSGSGLGLSMVQWIVKAHGGEILVESIYGVGSCFAFSIPKR